MISDDPSEVTVSCSEVRDYFYCPYSWWHADSGLAPEALEALRHGEEHHARFAETQTAKSHRKHHWLLLAAALLLAVIAIVLFLTGHAR